MSLVVQTGACAINYLKVIFTVLFWGLVMLLAACLPEEQQGPVAQATLTPTPRSTPLPPVPTVAPPGLESSPIRMVVRAPGGVTRVISEAQLTAFEQALLEQSGLVVDVNVVERYAEALSALCDSTPTRVSVVWLDGLTYAAAAAQDCGEPVLQVEQRSATGDAVQIIAGKGVNLSSIQGLRRQTFCRLGYDDYAGWLVGSLLLRANGVDPLGGLEEIVDYPDFRALVAALSAGDCPAAAMTAAAYDDLSGSVRRDLKVLGSTPPLPYGVLMFPIYLPLGERLRLIDGLLALAADADQARVLRPFFGQDALVTVGSKDFEDLVTFLRRTGLDFAQLGG